MPWMALASGGSEGFLNAHHYDQIFTAHGVIMIFFMAMPFITGLMNVVVPLQIGARDVAFPRLNLLSWYIYVTGSIFAVCSIIIGGVAESMISTWVPVLVVGAGGTVISKSQ